MKKRTVQPKSGQFVAVWEYDSKCWSRTFKIDENGTWYKLCTVTTSWVVSDLGAKVLEDLEPIYFVE